MDITQLPEVLHGQPQFRFQQINHLLYQDLIVDWQQATVLPKALMTELALHCPLTIIAMVTKLPRSSSKAVITLADGLKIETVLINNTDGRHTVCVSSQVGCPLGCKFCATGAMGFKRNLTSQEIVEQVLYWARQLKDQDESIDNIVFMGMGEPLLNIDNVLSAIKIINDPESLNLGSRRISVSTVGIKAGLDKIMRSSLQINLAISLHAPTDKLRAQLMPVHQNTSLKELMAMVAHYTEQTNRQVMFEYIMLKEVNDNLAEAEKLAVLLDNHRLYMVNLINYNQTGKFRPSTPARIRAFQNILLRAGLKVTVRDSQGQASQAACGQLAVT
ncbi:MAG: 23S rRNA (adenine(2503)-C(2))-methyltransferase RlmN [bacterium]